MTGRRDRVAREGERAARRSDRPTRHVDSDAAGWATITPVEDQRDDSRDAGRYTDEDSRGRRYSDDDSRSPRYTDEDSRSPRYSDDDSRDAGRYTDEDSRGRRYFDDDREPPSLRDDTLSRVSRTTSARDEPRRRDRYADDEPRPASDSGSWGVYDDEPVRTYDAGSRRVYDSEPRSDYDEPRRSRRSVEEGPRRSRRALEESARQTRDDEPRSLRGVDDDDESGRRLGAGEDDLLGRQDVSDFRPPRTSNVPEPRSRHYRDDSDAGSWRTRQTTEFETWRSENADAQRWRSETVSWRTHETIEVDTSDIRGFGTRAIGSSAIGSSASSIGGPARHADSADLETWRSETGTWRTRDTATTGSWRLPPSSDDASTLDGDTGSLDGDTGEWRSRTTPETGSWSRSRGQWVAGSNDTGEQADFSVRRYDDTGEIPKSLLQAGGRILDHDEFFESGPRGDSGDGRRVGRRRAADDDRADDRAGERSDEWLGRRPADRPVGDRSEDDRPDTAGWSSAGSSRRALSSRSRDLDDGYRDSSYRDNGYRDSDEAPGGSSRYPRRDDDAPGYRAGRRSAAGSRAGRHASDGYNDEDERPRAVTRRASAYAGPRGAADSVITPRAAAGRGELVSVGRRLTVPEDDEDDATEVAYGYAGAGYASVAWFGLPIGAFLLWAVFLGGTARADCVDGAGRPCPAPRDAAFTTFAAHLPQVGVAIVLSVVVALLIRLVSPFWRAATVGFAASVVGAGVTTVLFTVLNSG